MKQVESPRIRSSSSPPPSAVTRVVIVDDHRAIRELLVSMLQRREANRYEVVAEGGTGDEALELTLTHLPDILVLDLVLPGINGVEVLSRLRRKVRGLRVVFFSGCTQEQLIAQAIALGANAYVRKTQSLQMLVEAIECVREGGTFIDPTLDQINGRASILPGWQVLTPREQQVARLIAEGKSTKEAATALGVSAKTLDKHRSSMMHKLNLHDAVSVARYAIITGLTSLD